MGASCCISTRSPVLSSVRSVLYAQLPWRHGKVTPIPIVLASVNAHSGNAPGDGLGVGPHDITTSPFHTSAMYGTSRPALGLMSWNVEETSHNQARRDQRTSVANGERISANDATQNVLAPR
ncbi:hypothetical protein JZ751_023943 [Albula glossodonta]|uniref:Uncharacterized protein n=1 Tax=Albula glossodonta TaxID=121402 RepID=A0A8T2NSD1_9TELE|nr:hypothetical protein JZ751_023943 [Albula glossodonta]